MAKFKKGDKRPSNSGRQKGSGNKKDEDLRKLVKDGLLAEGDKPFTELQKLEGKEYIESYERLMKYVLPTLKAVEHSGEVKDKKTYKLVIRKNYIKTDD